MYGGPWVSRHNQISHSTTKKFMAQPNSSWHNQTAHGTTKYLMAQPNISRQNQKLLQKNQINHGKTKFLIPGKTKKNTPKSK